MEISTDRDTKTDQIIPPRKSLPDVLTNRPTWINWKRGERNGKETKIPVDPRGNPISATDPGKTISFEEAVQNAQKNKAITGVGYCFNAGGPYVGIDLDDCRNPETKKVDRWAQDLVKKIGSWTEISPSGTGLHILTKGELPDGGKKAGPVEIYDNGRYFTVTGWTYEEGKGYISTAEEALFELYQKVQAAAGDNPETREVKKNGSTVNRDTPSVYDFPGISREKYPPKKRTEHPIHGSTTGENFHIDPGGETFRCWRHDKTGNIWNLVAMKTGLADCDERLAGSDKWPEIYEEAEKIGIETPEFEPKKTGNDTVTDDEKNPVVSNLPGGVKGIAEAERKELAYAAAEYLSNTDEIKAVRTRKKAELYQYKTGIWTPGGKQGIGEKIRPHVGTEFTSGLQTEIANHLRAISPVDRDKMGAPSGTVAVKNGILELETCELADHDPDHNALWKMDVQFDPDATCDPFLKYLREVVQDERQEDVIRTIFEFIGYALQPRTHLKKALMIFGPTDSGKSVLFKVIQKLFGEENDAGQSLQYLANERWGTSYLYGKPINCRADLGPGSIKDLGIIKEITAGDRITAERKGKPLFQFSPRTKLMFSANQAPQRDTEDEAFWNRWITIKFPEQIPEEEQDKELVEKLTKPEILSGILNEAIAGWHRLQDLKNFSYDPGPWETKDLWLEYGNTLQQFLQDAVEITGDADDYVPKDKLYSAYSEYARERADKMETKNKFTRGLKKAGGSTGRKRINGTLTRVYTGVSLEANDGQPGFD